ncbi:site-specific integrase [Paraburkholderia panacisoli]|uniref:Site-specific integrase n=2 Tax=Paraburkholderia panacisoli TaxID=2603818 RepID=A0A5B0HJJ8_9BURK|nr:site-specific integrase [Paraburkholderia panacisoli]
MFDATGAPIEQITSVDLLNYKGHVGSANEWKVALLSGLFKRWHAHGLPGVAYDAIVLLRQLRLKANIKGAATATMDPVKGPFTNIELEALQTELNASYGRREIALSEYVLCWLFMLLGQRPKQYAALKVRDMVTMPAKDGLVSYCLRVPRAKTRDSDARGAFKERMLTPQVGKLVANYALRVQSDFTGVLDDPLDAPLFPAKEIGAAPDGYSYHATAANLGYRLQAALKALNVVSERTCDLIHISPKRFRQTIGTRAAEEGHGELVIAELLDHSDTQHVAVYVGSTPAIVEKIDRAVALQMAPLAQAFTGKLIQDASESSRREDPASRIRAPAITGTFEAVSSCGKHGFCGFLKPIACYTCNSFEPWLDGPHEQVLDYLLRERERLMETTDMRIASINDRGILAVAQVIQLCEEVRASRNADNG